MTGVSYLELGEPNTAGCHRYKKIVVDSRMIDTLLVDLFLDSERRPPTQVVLDLDATDDAVHGITASAGFDCMDDLSSQDKSYLLGYDLLDLVGKEFLAAVLGDPNRRAEYLLPAAAHD